MTIKAYATSNKLSIYNVIKNRFPVFESYPLLKYSLIPLLISLFVGLRYVLKFIVNELAAWSSNFVRETTAFNISEKTIVFSVAAILILLRIGLRFRNQKRKSN